MTIMLFIFSMGFSNKDNRFLLSGLKYWHLKVFYNVFVIYLFS